MLQRSLIYISSKAVAFPERRYKEKPFMILPSQCPEDSYHDTLCLQPQIMFKPSPFLLLSFDE